ncbi:hypothetical protein JJV70_20270 [Streptomyces sp. JJ66]|uniref:hypothetical protein n=1 Tax=Streptomyces sp. JJ66 TaxID=2803843 RepID=UPI001C56A980|nr:hypothetical protein [Streptomyces sp. JJ66]MBW1604395.1 hypothetical protein [Streptomyces sp. JJ66]
MTTERGQDAAMGGSGAPRPPQDHPATPAEEDALRRLLHDAVRDIEPSPHSLDHLRRAVPARRARRRHVTVGLVAAVLVGAVTVPAMTTGVVPNPLGGDERARTAQGGPGGPGEPYGGREQAGQDGGGADGGGKGPQDGERPGEKPAEPAPGASPAPDDSAGLGASSPLCLRDQLGDATARVGEPDANGARYGSFSFTNLSGDSCRVTEDTDQLSATGQGASAVTVLDHTEGGRATGLPSPASAPHELILRPGESFQVRFAWLPDTARGADGCVAPDPSPAPEPEPSEPGATPGGGGGSGGAGGEGGQEKTTEPEPSAGDESGTTSSDDGSAPAARQEPGLSTQTHGGTGSSGQGDSGPGGTASAVVLRYTPAAGEPQAPAAHLTNVCAGTVYRTGVLPGA